MSEWVDPIIELFAHLHQSVPDLGFPNLDQRHGGCVLNDSAVGGRLDRFIVFHVVLVLLIDVDEALLTHHAEEAAPRIHLLWEEDSGSIVVLTVDGEGGVGDFLLRVDQESIIHDILGDVTLHVFGLLAVILQVLNDVHNVLLVAVLVCVLGVVVDALWLAIGVSLSEGARGRGTGDFRH